MLQGRQGWAPLIFRSPDEPPGGGSGGSTPPNDNLVGEARRKQQEAEQRARQAEADKKALEDRIAALEGANDSEVTRAVKRAEKAEQERDAARAELSSTTRKGHIRDALDRLRGSDKRMQAHDPAAVEAMLGTTGALDTIDSTEKAYTAVEALAQSHQFLFAPVAPGVPAPGTPPGTPPVPAPGFGVPAGGGAPPGSAGDALPTNPDGSVDRDRALGAGLFNALTTFRQGRAAGAGEQQQ